MLRVLAACAFGDMFELFEGPPTHLPTSAPSVEMMVPHEIFVTARPTKSPTIWPTKYSGRLPLLPDKIPGWFVASAVKLSGANPRVASSASAAAAKKQLRHLEATVAAALTKLGHQPNVTQLLERTVAILTSAHNKKKAAGNGGEAAQITLAIALVEQQQTEYKRRTPMPTLIPTASPTMVPSTLPTIIMTTAPSMYVIKISPLRKNRVDADQALFFGRTNPPSPHPNEALFFDSAQALEAMMPTPAPLATLNPTLVPTAAPTSAPITLLERFKNTRFNRLYRKKAKDGKSVEVYGFHPQLIKPNIQADWTAVPTTAPSSNPTSMPSASPTSKPTLQPTHPPNMYLAKEEWSSGSALASQRCLSSCCHHHQATGVPYLTCISSLPTFKHDPCAYFDQFRQFLPNHCALCHMAKALCGCWNGGCFVEDWEHIVPTASPTTGIPSTVPTSCPSSKPTLSKKQVYESKLSYKFPAASAFIPQDYLPWKQRLSLRPTPAPPTPATQSPTLPMPPTPWPTHYVFRNPGIIGGPPTQYPTEYPSAFPTGYPSEYPTKYPTSEPTIPTSSPSLSPTKPTAEPTAFPTWMSKEVNDYPWSHTKHVMKSRVSADPLDSALHMFSSQFRPGLHSSHQKTWKPTPRPTFPTHAPTAPTRYPTTRPTFSRLNGNIADLYRRARSRARNEAEAEKRHEAQEVAAGMESLRRESLRRKSKTESAFNEKLQVSPPDRCYRCSLVYPFVVHYFAVLGKIDSPGGRRH
jgi:insulin receptor substrate 1